MSNSGVMVRVFFIAAVILSSCAHQSENVKPCTALREMCTKGQLENLWGCGYVGYMEANGDQEGCDSYLKGNAVSSPKSP